VALIPTTAFIAAAKAVIVAAWLVTNACVTSVPLKVPETLLPVTKSMLKTTVVVARTQKDW
jgi:hypothetical protein